MNERNHVTFNHGYLCEMLRMASDNELANVINDVQKIQKQRKVARKQMHAIAIKNAIDAAIKDGYVVKFVEQYTDDLDEATIFGIHANNSLYTAITLEED